MNHYFTLIYLPTMTQNGICTAFHILISHMHNITNIQVLHAHMYVAGSHINHGCGTEIGVVDAPM